MAEAATETTATATMESPSSDASVSTRADGSETTGGAAPAPEGGQTTAETQTPESQTSASPWLNILPDEYRNKGYVKNHDTLEGFLKHVDYWEGMRGRGIYLPEDPNDPQYEEKVRTVYKKLGAPDDPEAYQFDLPEGAPINQSALEAFRRAAAREGLNQRQADGIFKEQLESARQQLLRNEQTKAQMIADMRDTWGASVFAHKDGLAREMARRMGIHDELDTNGFFCLPHVVEAFADMAEVYQDGGMMPPGSPSGRSLGEVQDELDKLTVTGGPYWNTSDRNHQRTKERVKELRDLRAVMTSRSRS